MEELQRIMDEEQDKEEGGSYLQGSLIQDAQPYTVSASGRLRYDLEHRMLREHFYRDRDRTVLLVQAEDGLYTLFKKVFQAEGVEMPYQPKDFRAVFSKHSGNLSLGLLELPEPEYTSLCFRIYFVTDSLNHFAKFFTVERKGNEGMICIWDDDGKCGLTIPQKHPKWMKSEKDFRQSMETGLVLKIADKIRLSL